MNVLTPYMYVYFIVGKYLFDITSLLILRVAVWSDKCPSKNIMLQYIPPMSDHFWECQNKFYLVLTYVSEHFSPYFTPPGIQQDHSSMIGTIECAIVQKVKMSFGWSPFSQHQLEQYGNIFYWFRNKQAEQIRCLMWSSSFVHGH